MQQHLMPLHSSIFLLTLETPNVRWSPLVYCWTRTQTIIRMCQSKLLTIKNRNTIISNICRSFIATTLMQVERKRE